MGNCPKLVGYFPVRDPFFPLELLECYELARVDYIEIGLKQRNPYIDGKVIKDSMIRSYGNGELEDITKTVQAIDKIKNNPKKVLFMYADKKYLKRNSLLKEIDCILCPGRLGGLRERILALASSHKVSIVEFMRYRLRLSDYVRARSATAYVMLQYSEGKTGIRNFLNRRIKNRIVKLREHGVIKPIFVGVGVSSTEQVKHALDSGADGVVLGSAILLSGLKGKSYLQDYLCKIREVLDGR